MLFNHLVKARKDCLERYIFYRGLGYSVEASELLSCITYGDGFLAYRMESLRGDDALAGLRKWLEEQDEADPQISLRAYYDRCHRRPEPEESYFACYSYSKPSPPSPKNIMPKMESFSAGSMPKAKRAKSDAARGTSGSIHVNDCCDLSALSISLSAADSSHGGGFFSYNMVEPELVATDAYETIEEKSAKGVFTAPSSTFRMTTSTASMGILFNQLRSGRYIDMDQVRIEEILNYFDYDAGKPVDAKFSINTELLPKGEGKKLLYINAQAAEEQREHQNIVVLLDVSGSMSCNDVVTQATVAAILSKLHAGDRFSLVTYSSTDRTVVDGYRIESDQDKEKLMGVLLGLEITGCTYGSAGIKTAYALGAKYYREGWSNQVMLITDGDLNFGITDKGGLKDLIEEKKKSGLFLSVIGTGLWNYKDDKLEVLSKHGNGTYCVVNSLADVTESVDRRYIALTNIIAKDVKAQVEFNPRFVKSYRLLGYENRELSHEDFVDDTVISEPYGSGGHGVALYELEMGEAAQAGLKYQTAAVTGSDELCTVKLRYKEPLEDVSHEIEAIVFDRDTGTKNVELARLLYCVSEKLRDSDKLDEADEAWLKEMVSGGKYKSLTDHDAEKLTLFVEAMLLNGGNRM